MLLLALAAAEQRDPAQFPARDSHDGITVGCDPVTDREVARARFGKKHPWDAGILALDVFMRNDTDQAVNVDAEAIRLVLAPPGGSRQRLRPLDLEAVVDAIVYKEPPDLKKPRVPVPRGPLPRSSKSKEWEKVSEALRPLSFEMTVLPPRSTARGFFYFHLGGDFSLLRHAQFYVPGLTWLQSGKALMFFEVDLGATAPK
jgi:hypothetical protein